MHLNRFAHVKFWGANSVDIIRSKRPRVPVTRTRYHIMRPASQRRLQRIIEAYPDIEMKR